MNKRAHEHDDTVPMLHPWTPREPRSNMVVHMEEYHGELNADLFTDQQIQAGHRRAHDG